MNRSRSVKYTIQFVILLGGALGSARLVAQQRDSAWWNMDYIRHANARISSESVTGLTSLPVDKISTASVSFSKADGPFRNFYQSDNSYTVSAATESFYRMSPQVVLQGAVLYENFNGRNMNGSAFIDPYKSPFDIDEYSDTTAGKKKLERYLLSGAISAGISRRFTIGGRLNYEAANYAKMKDLRHVNKLTDIQATAGGAYQLSQALQLGVDYSYQRRIESVGFAIHGNMDGRRYVSLINFGSFYGLAELHTDQALTADTRPMVNNIHTASLYMDLTIQPGIELFNRFSYGKRSGYFGERETFNTAYTEHSASQYAYEGVLSVKKEDMLHTIQWKAGYEDLSNGQNIPRSETSPGGNTITVNYGRTEVLVMDITSSAIDYTAYIRVRDNNPLWTLRAGADYTGRQQTVNRYPFYRKQDIQSYRLHVGAGRNIIQGKHMFSLSLGLLYGGGGGTAKNDGTYIPPSSSTPPATKDAYLYQEFEYLTKPRFQVDPGVRYSTIIDKNITAFLQLSYQYTKAFDVQYTGSHYNCISLTAGCSF